MAPKVIESEVFKNRKELTNDTIEKLVVKGGSVALRESLSNTWGYDPNEKIAVPTIVIAGDGRIGGVKWSILGKSEKKATIRGIQLWPDCQEDIIILA